MFDVPAIRGGGGANFSMTKKILAQGVEGHRIELEPS